MIQTSHLGKFTCSTGDEQNCHRVAQINFPELSSARAGDSDNRKRGLETWKRGLETSKREEEALGHGEEGTSTWDCHNLLLWCYTSFQHLKPRHAMPLTGIVHVGRSPTSHLSDEVRHSSRKKKHRHSWLLENLISPNPHLNTCVSAFRMTSQLVRNFNFRRLERAWHEITAVGVITQLDKQIITLF